MERKKGNLGIILLVVSSLVMNAASLTYWRDVKVLKQLKRQISGDSVSGGSCISSWDFAYDPCDSLSSDKFTCGFTCEVVRNISRVTEVALDQASYSAPLSSISWNLPLLRSLDLTGNNFSGPIPDSLSNLTRLTRLTLSRNSLSGSIPPSLGRLPNLEELFLDYNYALVGPIPTSFSGLLNLKRLDLQGNKLTGDFPDLSPLATLNALDCSDNSITGQLLVSNLPPSLVELSMRNNHFEGTLQDDMVTKLPLLQVLDLSYNQLRGCVPQSYFTHPTLQQLSLSNNNLTAIQLPGIGGGPPLIALDLSNNHLTGLLPGFLGLMPKLSALALENNSFIGLIPTQYAFKAVSPQPGIAPFQRLLLGGNYLFGPIPDPLMELQPGSTRINLGDNCLWVCPYTLFFCQGGHQKSLLDCRNSIGPLIP